MSNWWANKLGTPPPPGVPVAPMYQQPQPVQQTRYQGGMTAQEIAVHQRQEQEDPNRKLSLREAVSRFKGGEGARTEGDIACPACGDYEGYTQFSGMAGAAAGVNGMRPAPHCYKCGYNGKFQQGDPSTWGAVN